MKYSIERTRKRNTYNMENGKASHKIWKGEDDEGEYGEEVEFSSLSYKVLTYFT